MDQLELIGRLMDLEPPLYLFGGYAEDALLYGRTSRPHNDVDILVWADELSLRLAQAGSIGFTDFAVRWESAPNQPLAVGAVADGVDLEFCVVQRSADGSPFFDLPTASGLKRVWLAVPMLASEDQVLEGIRVRTLSPLALYQIRSALADVMGGLRPKDVTAQAALRARFFSDKAEAELAPRVEILTNSGARSE